MTISFDNIPTTIRTPFNYVEVNPTRAQQGPTQLPYKALIIGQKLSTGTWTADTVNRATSVDQVITGAGRGSIAHRQALAWFSVNKSTEAWFGVLSDNGAGVAATGTIVFTAAATGAGTIPFYFGGERVPVAVASGDATTVLATSTRDAINANLDLPFTASASISTVTLTWRHKGEVGNNFNVRTNYRDGEVLPAGVAMTITQIGGVVAGNTNPTLTTLISNIADLWFHIWTHPYTDATSLSAIEAELLSRFGPTRSIDGQAVAAAQGSFSTLSTLGLTRNSPHSEIWAQPGATPLVPPMEFAAGIAGLIATAGSADAARPFTTLALPQDRFPPPAETDQWSADERNLFLYDGIATTVRAAGGIIRIERAITTYRTSPSGATDTAYLDVTTLLTLMYLRYDWRTLVQRLFPRHKLADDGTQFGAGQPVVTPQLMRGVAQLWFKEKEKQGLVEGAAQFERDLIVERNTTDPNRLDVVLPPDLINQLLGVATSLQFRL